MTVPLVKVNQGTLKGVLVENEFGNFISFNGIPYAEPPIGELRFKDPQPPKPWNGVRETINEGIFAPQINFLNLEFVGSDDCLYLNVSTKNLSGKKPVMVWIHGGGFFSGSGNADFQRPDYFLKHDIIFVSINYRLGILGFLNMEIENCSGNQGLKDQVLALKWIQENIAAFGGDKENVTIFGESAGGTSVHYLCISPLAKGLFHKAICQSGVSINPWAFQTSNKELAFRVAAGLGYLSSNNEEIVQFLQTIPVEKIIQAQNKVYDKNTMKLGMHFVPTMDDKCPNPFLPKPLSEMVKNGIDVPLIIGYNSQEGLFMLVISSIDKLCKKINGNFDEYLSTDLKVSLSTVSQFSKDVRNFYFKRYPVTKQDQDNVCQYEGDVFIVNGILHIIESQAQKRTPTYFYKYSHNPEFSLMQVMRNTKMKGACHGDELTHLFYKPAFPANVQLQKGTVDYLLMQRMTKMWTDFAKTGDPTPESCELVNAKWTPYTSDRKSCLLITEDLKIIENFEEKSWTLWKPIFEKHKLF